MTRTILLASLLSWSGGALLAGEADVLEAEIRPLGDGRFQVDTTVRHADTGWDHYAIAWEVLDENGHVLGKRVLLHPHVDEQPFTRGHSLAIPEPVNTVTIRAMDSVHGFGGETVTLAVPRGSE